MTGAGTGEDRARTPDELRGDLGELRSDLGDTVEELTHRVDVPSRVRAKGAETTARVQEQVGQAREALADRAPAVERTLREQPALVGGLAAALGLLLFGRMRRRKKKTARNGKDDDGTR
jgi:ElaB/YqjD/DUF883 family membrane-anchored ribosome-binding protein